MNLFLYFKFPGQFDKKLSFRPAVELYCEKFGVNQISGIEIDLGLWLR